MSYCLKTGGLIVIEDQGCAYECDLHVVGDTIVAILAGAPQYDEKEIDSRRIQLYVRAGGDYMQRPGKPYGVLVARAEDCAPTRALRAHMDEHYTRYQKLNLREVRP